MRININRLAERLDLLAEIGRDDTGGWSRFSFTENYLKACNLVKKWMEEAGMIVEFDTAGNLIGRLNSNKRKLPVVAMGSHIDTVKNGGKFDGSLGVLGAIEVVQTIKENGVLNDSPIEIIVFNEEEGSRFGVGLLGSRAIVGEIDVDFLERHKDSEGISISDGYRHIDFSPDKITDAKKSKKYYKSYIELHVEQGKVLDSKNMSVGIVEAIAGYIWLKAKIEGCADHAGATPMDLRKDALTTAAEIILATEQICDEVSDTLVATVGTINVKPNSTNVVPGSVEMTFDIRDTSDETINIYVKKLKNTFMDICKKRGVHGTIEELISTKAVKLASNIVQLVEDVAIESSYEFHKMVSGAAHDAQKMASITDVAMIFAPSKDGISHSPDEWTEIEDIEICTNVLLKSIIKLIQN